MKARTRFAPSPTGKLHIGGIRTALYCYALANKTKGNFVLRIEDTDQGRLVEGSVELVFEMLKEYHIEPDESAKNEGSVGPYVQSERLDLYKEYAEILIENGDAYYCFATKEEIDEQRKASENNGERFRFRSPYRDLSIEEANEKIDNGESYVIRQKVPTDTKVDFEDPIQGKMQFDTSEVDDTVLLKSDGFPTYHLAVVVDDHLMGITHVFRGVEWIPSAPKHVLLYKSFGWEPPVIAHVALILDPKGGKLSKRNGSVSADEFLIEGYLPEAILNFLMLLGWSSSEERVHGEKEREFYSLADFVELFDIKDLNKASAVFNREKLVWFNQKYISTFTPDQFVLKFTAWLKKYGQNEELKNAIIENGPDYLESILVLVQERTKLLAEIPEQIESFYFAPDKSLHKEIFSNTKQTKKLDFEQIKSVILEFSEELEKQKNIESWGHEGWEQTVRRISEDLEIKAGQAFMILRIVVLGSPFSPPLFESMEVLGKNEVLERLA